MIGHGQKVFLPALCAHLADSCHADRPSSSRLLQCVVVSSTQQLPPSSSSSLWLTSSRKALPLQEQLNSGHPELDIQQVPLLWHQQQLLSPPASLGSALSNEGLRWEERLDERLFLIAALPG